MTGKKKYSCSYNADDTASGRATLPELLVRLLVSFYVKCVFSTAVILQGDLLSALKNFVRHNFLCRKINEIINSRPILLLAPGKSLRGNTDYINSFISSGKYFVMSVNFIPTDINVNAAFISNMRRFKNIKELVEHSKRNVTVIITSNILTDSSDDLYVVDYSSYTNEEQCISDNAGLMCINFLKKIGVREVVLAGFDGFSQNENENFYDSSMAMSVESEMLMRMNTATSKKLKQFKSQIDISFLTDTVYGK